jgi:DNA primase
VDGVDDKGRAVLEKEEYQNTVSNELYLNLQEDEIEFANEIFKLTYYQLVHQLNQDEKISIDQLIMHENQDISSLVTNILMDEEKYSLSDWERKEIFVTETKKILPKLVSDAILNIRRVLIEEKIKEIIHEVQTQNAALDLEEISNYTDLKKRLFEKLNRVV